MPDIESLKPSSVLFWLAALLGVGIIVIGVRFLFVPLSAARDFGAPVYGSSTFAYLWAKGSRDVVLGLLMISLLGLGVRRVVLATFIFVATLVPIADFVNVYINFHSARLYALMVHGGTAIFMLILASLILRGSAAAKPNRRVTIETPNRRTA